jgi:hypothetical protein
MKIIEELYTMIENFFKFIGENYDIYNEHHGNMIFVGYD